MTVFTANPQPADLHLVVEISASTLYFDLNRKAQLYARAGISEYWVLDVSGRRLIVHRNPTENKWGSIATYDEQQPVSPLAAPEAEFRATLVLPPRD